MTSKRSTAEPDIETDQAPKSEAPQAEPQAVERVPSVAGNISGLASANAPFIFFDEVPFLGHISGVGQITLSASRYIAPGPGGGAAKDHVVTCHLRASLPALQQLRAAIDQVEKMIVRDLARTPEAGETPIGLAH